MSRGFCREGESRVASRIPASVTAGWCVSGRVVVEKEAPAGVPKVQTSGKRSRWEARAAGLGALVYIVTCACAREAPVTRAMSLAPLDAIEGARGAAGDIGGAASEVVADLPPSVRAPADPRRRATPEVLPGDLVAGPGDAPVTVVALLRLAAGRENPALHAVVRLAGRGTEQRLRVVFRPRLTGMDPADLRLARVFHALPDDAARLKWMSELLGSPADPWRDAARLAGPGAFPVQRADAPEIDGRLTAALREQARLAVDGDVVFVNGQRLEPAPSEADLVYAARRETQRLEKAAAARAEEGTEPPRVLGQAEEVGPRALAAAAAIATDDRLDLVAFVDFRDPHSRRLARHLGLFLRESPLAARLRLRLAAFPLDRHAGAAEAAAVARCALTHVEAAHVLATFFGDPYDRADVRPEGLCDALHLPATSCSAITACAVLPSTAEAVLAERATARAAGVQGPPALFLEGRRVAPRGRGFSRAFLEQVLLGYYLRTWTLPPDGRLGAVPWPSAPDVPDRRTP